MTRKQKLELTWVGKDERPRLEPRILLEDPSLSYHAARRVSANDRFDNMLIQGDNLLALKALEQEFAGKVKCVFIDPPYNTGSAFEHYDDGIEHSLWLSLVRARLELLRMLLHEAGSIWISIDDNEYAYLRVLCDEVFGRSNFVATIIWEKRKTRENRRVFSFKHDYVLVFAKHRPQFELTRNPIPVNDAVISRYRNPDNDSRGLWQSVAITAQAGHGTQSQFYTIVTPTGREIDPPPGNCWRYSQPRLRQLIEENRIYFGASGNNVPRLKKFLSESEDVGLTPETIWYADDVGTNDSAKRHSNELFDGKGFDNPKPEELLARILQISSNAGDLVLDSFAGSGTTGAVAHKMGRRWIMTELGENARTHCVARLKKVVDGTDSGGATEMADWHGGGGFRFFRLAPSLLEKDQWGNWVINKGHRPEMLAEALCKLEGFRYEPNPEVFWQHGRSTERDFVYVTTQTLNATQLAWFSEQVGTDRSLLILCNAWLGNATHWPNLTLKKIPNAVLGRCEFGRDDYSLQIAALPASDETEDAVATKPAAAAPPSRRRGRERATDPTQESLLPESDAE